MTQSKNPMKIPDESDLAGIQQHRDKLAADIQSQEFLNKSKESPQFQQLVLDSYLSMQTIERTAMLLDPKKPDFVLTFAGLRGRWLERKTLTEELLNGQHNVIRKRSMLAIISDKITNIRKRIESIGRNS